jgi:hypothetical protein
MRAASPKRWRHRFVQRFRAIEHDQQAAISAEPPALQVRQQALTERRVFRRAVPQTQHVFLARGIDPQRRDQAMVTHLQPIDQQRDEIKIRQ